jgi:hypothetical protein
MPDEKNQKKYIEIGESELSELVKDYDEFLRKMDILRKGGDPFTNKREEKRLGGIVPMMERGRIDIRPERKFRVALSEGGMTRDEEIGLHMFIVNMSPKSPADSFAVEQSRDWLEKNLTPAEKRQMDYPR